MKDAHNVLYMKKHTQTYAFISCDGHQLYDFKERGVDLEVEGVRYIEVQRRPAAHVLGPPPARGGDLELEGGVNACHIEYIYESGPETPTCEVQSNGVRCRDKLSVLVTLRFRLGRITEKRLTHCTAR